MRSKLRFLYVEWVDAVGPAESGWLTPDELAEYLQREMLIKECGWVVDQSKDYISLVAGLSEEPVGSEWVSVYHRLIRIPIKCIRKKKDLSRVLP